jgi:putative membrane protein
MTTWEFEPGVVVSLLLPAALYAAGQRKHVALAPVRKFLFWSGLFSLAVALLSPLHPLGEKLFSAHMLQHEILMLISAPLLVLSRPLVTFLWALPLEWRQNLGRWSKKQAIARSWSFLTAAFTAWLIHAVAIWAWHVPYLFQLTLRSDLAHTAQHLSFFLTALLFWWAVFYARGRKAYGAAFLSVFTTAIHTGILGALLTFSPRVWYPAYGNSMRPWGLSPLEDQQLGGLIMWIPASLVYLLAGLMLCSAWLKESDVRAARIAMLCILLAGCGRVGEVTTGGDPQRGAAAIVQYGCGSCHTIAGISGAAGLVGPPLTGIASRHYIAGVLTNTPDNLMRWLEDPKAIDEKTAMPKLGISPKDASDIGAYLYTLK